MTKIKVIISLEKDKKEYDKYSFIVNFNNKEDKKTVMSKMKRIVDSYK